MNYAEIINLIFLILGSLFALFHLHFYFFGISGFLRHKRYPPVREKCRYLVLASGKNEETVIGRLIQSVREADYPQDKLDILVVAHNCVDRTAEIASCMGAKVLVDDNKEEKTLGYAYKFAFEHIDNLSDYDGVVFFNADNTVAKDYFDKLNDAFVHYGKKDVVSSFRNILNAKRGILPIIYGFYFAISCLFGFSGRDNFGVSGRVTGCGFVIPVDYLKDGWKYLSITEDLEFSADSVLHGKGFRFCYEATFYGEQPTNLKTM